VTRRTVVLYDPQCPFCRACAGWLHRLDWRNRLELSGIVGAHQLHDGRRLPRHVLEQQLHVVAPDGRVFTGFFACRRLALATPALWPLVPLLYVPGMAILGTRMYDAVARHRDRLARLFRVS
jgi:predicted DCC family thiol-disulfide oxidoreductase YuxK